MQKNSELISQALLAAVVTELERLADDACDRWSLPKRDDAVLTASWRNREIAYRESLRLLADAGLAPAKYASRS